MAATVAVEMSGDEARLWRAQQKVLAQQAKMANEYKKVAKEAKDAKKAAEEQAKATEEAFGNRASAAIKNYAMSFVGLQAAIGLVTAGLREMQQAAEEAAQKKQQAAGSLGMLAQMAPTQAEFKKLTGQAKQLVSMGAASDEGEAARMVFDIHAAGAASEFDLLARAKAAGFLADPGQAAKAAQTMRVSMGEKETGSIGNLLSKGTAASVIAPGSVEQVLEASARSGGTAKAMGLSDEEVMAATAMAAAASGSPEMGGTQVASLLRSLAQNKDYQGIGSLEEMITKAQSESESFSETTDLLGRAEAVNALNAIGGNMAQYQQLLGEIRAANQTNIMEQRLGFAASDPSIRAAQLQQRAAGAEMLSREEVGTWQNLADAIQSEQVQQARADGGEIGATAAKFAAEYEQFLAGPESFVRNNSATDPESVKLQEDLIESNRSLTEALKHFAQRIIPADFVMRAASGQIGSKAPAQRAQQASVATQ